MKTLEKLLTSSKVNIGGNDFPISEYRLSVKSCESFGVHIAVHPVGDTKSVEEYIVEGNTLSSLTLSELKNTHKQFTIIVNTKNDELYTKNGSKKVVHSSELTRDRLLLLIGKDRNHRCTISYNDGAGYKIFNDVDIVGVVEGMVFNIFS